MILIVLCTIVSDDEGEGAETEAVFKDQKRSCHIYSSLSSLLQIANQSFHESEILRGKSENLDICEETCHNAHYHNAYH